MKKKSELRCWAKNIRKNLDIDQISEKICSVIREMEIYKQSKNIMLFYPLTYEINLLSLLTDNKNFYLPRVCGEDLEVCCYKTGDKLRCSELGIQEPTGKITDKKMLDLILAPALCVDKMFYRVGYGKGYYDRFCVGIEGKCLAVIPECLVVEEIETDDFDLRCDGIITEKKASFFRG